MLTAARATKPDSVDRAGTPDSRRRQIRLMIVDDHTAVRLGVTQLRANIDAPVLMDEEVIPDHLADEHASQQIIERVAWAVLDAQEVSRPWAA